MLKYQAQANGISSYYILAQQQFYNGNYEEALYFINQAAKIRENADVLALKGSIYLGLGLKEDFVESWKKALEMDKDIPLPSSPFVVKELQQQGLINENFKRNF